MQKTAKNVYLFNIFYIYLQCLLIDSSLTLCCVFVKILEKVSKIQSFFKLRCIYIKRNLQNGFTFKRKASRKA